MSTSLLCKKKRVSIPTGKKREGEVPHVSVFNMAVIFFAGELGTNAKLVYDTKDGGHIHGGFRRRLDFFKRTGGFGRHGFGAF